MLKGRAYKLRFRRRLRLQKRQVEEFGASAEQHLENNFFKRLERLFAVRRFVVTWMLLFVLLIGGVLAQTRGLSGYYQALVPTPGGSFTEGILGSFTNANPVYASGLVDSSVAELVFSGLLSYNDQNQLVGDLADSWTADERGAIYTVHLRPDLVWQDGAPLTSEDVVFTYQVIQNPDAKSPLFSSYQGVAVTAVDPWTVTFTLPNPLASFPYSLTNGIIPKHSLEGVVMADMRSVGFNSNPIGSGPFQWGAVEVSGGSPADRQERVLLKPFDNYHGGKPKLNSFAIRTYRGPLELIDAFNKQEINAAVGLSEVPPEWRSDSTIWKYDIPLAAEVMAFFRNSVAPFNDPAVRLGLSQAVDTSAIIANLNYATRPVREPLLPGQLAYDPRYVQPPFDPVVAAARLDAAGWAVGPDGMRSKAGTPLALRLSAQNGGEYSSVAQQIQKYWQAIGVKVNLDLQTDAEFQNTLAGHDYDVLLFGIAIGPDPDVYIYWHSSQVDSRSPTRLNFSEYKSAVADASLEAGRTRADPALRAIKYQPFLQAWQTDQPALGLYQPRFLYITHGKLYGLTKQAINTDPERFTNVQNWMVRETRVTPED